MHCPCGRGAYAHCCGPLHAGAPAADAEALMRSRYSAYALGLADYLLATWHPSTRPDTLDLHSDPPLRWLGLDVKRHLPAGDTAVVEFVARRRQGGARAEFIESAAEEKLGIALDTLKKLPLNAVRTSPENGTCGWYIWGGGDMSTDDDFFQPLHVSHIGDHCQVIEPYLGLGPGWRVQLAPGHEDVWFDPGLLKNSDA